MKSETTLLVENEIYPALFPHLVQALPAFEFRPTASGYRSTNALKLTGEVGDSRGAVVVSRDKPGRLYDFRGESLSIWDYLQREEGLDNRGVVGRLAELAGYTLPESTLSVDQMDAINRARRIGDAWEKANEFFIDCLDNGQSQYAQMPGAKRTRAYLTNPVSEGGRGYGPALFRRSGQEQQRDTPLMEIGFVPGLADLRYHLQDAGFGNAEIDDVIQRIEKPGPAVGRENIMSFPYRNQTGRIMGMVFRRVDSEKQAKYLYSDFKRKEVLFGLRAVSGDKDLVIVESPLDAMHAAALGISNVVALGGAGDSLNQYQIELAIKYGAQKFTLMLDNDGAGAKGTNKAVETLRRYAPDYHVYVATYPDGIKDLDELLIQQGREGLEQVIGSALAVWNYQLLRLLDRYNETGSREGVSDKLTDWLVDEVVSVASVQTATDKRELVDRFLAYNGIADLGISRGRLDERIDKQQQKARETKQAADLDKLATEIGQLAGKGQVGDALSRLTERSREIAAENKASSFAGLSQLYSEDQLQDAIRNRPPQLDSGFTIQEKPLLIPSGGISIIAALSSHGKSTMLQNLLLNLATKQPDKTFHLFSYEVDQESYMINLLNTYIGDDALADNNRAAIERYFRGADPKFKETKQSRFDQKREGFFKTFINTGRIKIHYVTYDSDELIDAIRYLHKTESVGAVLIDYIQLISPPAGKLRNASRQEEIKQICLDFKDLGNETKLPLIFAAQFNRDVDNLTQMHMKKLGEAGDLERVALLVLGIWNNRQKADGTPTKAEASIIKHRLNLDPKEDIEPSDTWYVEVLKARFGRVGIYDVWDYLPNASKVSSSK